MGVAQSFGLGVGGSGLSVTGGPLRGPRTFNCEHQNSVEYRMACSYAEIMIQLFLGNG